MKKTKFLALLVAVLALAGCDDPKESSTPADSTPPVESSTPEQSSTPNESSTPDESSTPEEQVKHQDPLVGNLADGALTRKYKEAFDTMVDDFSGESLVGSTEGGVVSSHPRLRVLVDSANGDFPSSPDGAIYKMATGSYEIHNFEGIGFKIRKVGEGKLDLSNLVLGLRGDDAYKVFEIPLESAVNPDSEPLNELTDQYQDLIVCPNLSLESDATEYELAAGGASGVKVLEKILGFHLYAKGEVSQMIEIEEVYLMNAGEKTVLDAFNREAVNKADDTCYWRDSTGFIIGKNIMLKDGASYRTPEIAVDKTNLVLNVSGDTSSTTIAPITASGVQASVAWADLKDENNQPVASAVNGGFHPIAISLANSNLALDGVIGFEIKSNSEVYVSQIFLSSL